MRRREIGVGQPEETEGPPPRRQREPVEARRARMRVEGARLVARHGIGGASLMEVARAARIPKGSAYYYYWGWDELLGDIVERHVDFLHEAFGTALDAYDAAHGIEEGAACDGTACDGAARLEAGFSALLAAVVAQEAEHRVQFAALHAVPAGMAERLQHQYGLLVAAVGFAIGDAVPGLGERRTMQVTAAMSVIAMVNEYIFWRERQPRMTPALYGRVLAHVALTLGAYGVAATKDAADDPFPKWTMAFRGAGEPRVDV